MCKIKYEDMLKNGRCINIIDGKECRGILAVDRQKGRIECCRCGIIVTKDNHISFMNGNH